MQGMYDLQKHLLSSGHTSFQYPLLAAPRSTERWLRAPSVRGSPRHPSSIPHFGTVFRSMVPVHFGEPQWQAHLAFSSLLSLRLITMP